jgi:hypothetical protein
MLTRLMPTTAPAKSQGANQMRQQLTMGEHFRRGNARRRDNSRRSFGEKIAMMEALRERLAPFKRLREQRRAAKSTRKPDDAS